MRHLGCLTALVVLLAAGPAHAEEPDAKADRARIDAVFEQMKTASLSSNRAGIVRLFDVEALLATIQETKVFDSLPGPVRARIEGMLAIRLPTALAGRDVIHPFPRFEIRSVMPGTTATRRQVSVRHFDADGYTTKVVWYLVQVGDAYRIHDFEDLDLGLRISALFAAGFAAGVEGGEAFKSAIQGLLAAKKLIEEEAYDEARAHLDRIADIELSGPLMAFREILRAGLGLVTDEDPNLALQQLQRARAIRPDMPLAVLLESAALLALEKWPEAEARARHYIRLVGKDAQALTFIGMSFLGRERKPDAVRVFEAALVEDPRFVDAIAYLSTALPADKKAQAIARFAALPDAVAQFEGMAETILEEGDTAALRLLVAAFEKKAPAHADVFYYRGQAAYLEEDLKAAAAQFRLALEKADARRRAAPEKEAIDLVPYASAWCDAMLEQGQGVKAFGPCPDKAWALDYLGWDFSAGGNIESLQALVAEATPALGAAHVGVRFFAAEARFLGEQYERAIPGLTKLRDELVKKGDALTDRDRDYYWEAEDRLVRAHLRAKQLDKARALALEIEARDDDPRYRLVVAATEGKTAEAVEALRKCLEEADYDPTYLFEDEDIREILKGEAYADLRKRFYGK